MTPKILSATKFWSFLCLVNELLSFSTWVETAHHFCHLLHLFKFTCIPSLLIQVLFISFPQTTTSQTVHSRPFVTTVIPSGIVSTSAAMSNVVTQAAGGGQLASPAVSNIGNSGIEIIKTIPSAASLGSTGKCN